MKTKLIAIASLAVIAVSVLAGCGGAKFTCDNCGEEKTGKKYSKEVLGETVTYCGECKEEVESMIEFIEALGNLDLSDAENDGDDAAAE